MTDIFLLKAIGILDLEQLVRLGRLASKSLDEEGFSVRAAIVARLCKELEKRRIE